MRKPRSRYHHGDLRASAISAATAELDRQGGEQITLERVAKLVGVTTPALYRHFKSREELLAAVIFDVFKGFAARVDAAALSTEEPAERLRAAGIAYLDFALANRGWFRLQFSRLGAAQAVRHEDADLKYPPLLFAAIASLRQLEDEGEIATWFLLWWSTLHGISSLLMEHVWPHLSTDAARRAEGERLVSAFIEGLDTRTPKKPRRGRSR